ncbi:MAG: ArsB/NhaD family transporter [Planctomycetes bacterium]|nr:ArsB/NhaD family transporter [Planctomycetota bacterium]
MIALLIIFALTYIAIASEKVDKGIAAILGATAAIAGRFIDYQTALQYIDLNVIMLIAGMMIMVNILSRTGLFEWLAVVIAQKARGNGVVIFLMLLLTTAVLSAFLDNVTTIILIAPVSILLTQILELPAIPWLVLEAVFSNIGGTATLVGDPPNVLIGSQAHIPFHAFLNHLGLVVLGILLVSMLVAGLVYRRIMRVRRAAFQRIAKADAKLAIVDPRRLKIGLAVFGLVITGFFLGPVLRIEPGIVALAGGVLMTHLCGIEFRSVLEKVEWTTLLFFMGLFMLVGALAENGAFAWLGDQLLRMTSGNLMLTVMVLLWVTAIGSAIVDNIPLVMAMIPLIKAVIPGYALAMGIQGDPQAVYAQVTMPLFWALALGACLGGNGTLVGASANVVISQIARKNNYPLTFWRFTRVGFPFMVLSLLLSTGYLYLRYFWW